MNRTEALPAPLLWLGALLGAGVGVGAARVAEMPARWIVAVLAAALAAPAILIARRPARAALFVFTFSLQVGLVLYLTPPPPVSSIGASWPNSLALPLASLTALGALALGVRRPFVWGRRITASTALLLLTTAASIAVSPVRFISVCHLVVLLAYFLVFLAAANTVHDEHDLNLVWRALMASLALQCVVYFAQVAVGATFTPSGEWIKQPEGALGRYGGTVGPRPAVFSSFLLPLLLLAVTRFLTAPRPLRSGLLAAIGCTALILTFTRASWIAFVLGMLYLLTAGARRGLLVRRHVIVLLGVLLGLTVALSPRILMRVCEDHGAAVEERWALVQMALRVIQAHPLAGVGAGAYPYVFREYLTPELADRWLFVVHNVYVLRAAETGLPGLAALLVFLGAAFWAASPDRMAHAAACRLALGWRAGLIALAWEMLWDVSLGPATNSLLWFLCGLLVAAARLRPARVA